MKYLTIQNTVMPAGLRQRRYFIHREHCAGVKLRAHILDKPMGT